jgi:hypothetical protein
MYKKLTKGELNKIFEFHKNRRIDRQNKIFEGIMNNIVSPYVFKTVILVNVFVILAMIIVMLKLK